MAITPIKLSYEEFSQLPESNLPHELIDGELRMPAAPNLRHQRIVGHIFVPVNAYVEAHDLGIVIQSPADVVLDQDRPLVVQPDLLYITKERAAIARDKVFGAPDLTVEVSAGRGAIFDRTEKATMYAEYGVRQYWHVDPDLETVEVRRLERHGYEPVGVFRRGDRLRSLLFPDLRLSVDDIFAP